VSVEASWDGEYAAGRYVGEDAVGFVDDIAAACPHGTRALYVGCGNGRNFVPLLDAGLDLVGLDISRAAIDVLRARVPGARLVHGDVSALPDEEEFDAVIGIQVFQHGSRATAHDHIARAQWRVRPGGLFCIRVNAVGTDVWPDYELVEAHDDGGFTVRYRSGPKRGLEIHFFSALELDTVFAGWAAMLPPRLSSTRREPPAPGQWSQWEGIWRRP
jgi:hypothetical protein